VLIRGLQKGACELPRGLWLACPLRLLGGGGLGERSGRKVPTGIKVISKGWMIPDVASRKT
jgi:hypothetical protein